MENPFKKQEPYSREAFDAADKERIDAEKGYIGNMVGKPGNWVHGIHPDGRDDYEIPSPETKRYTKAVERWAKLKGLSQEEALKLEAKHQELTQKIKDAEQTLQSFEENELGMRSSKTDSEEAA